MCVRECGRVHVCARVCGRVHVYERVCGWMHVCVNSTPRPGRSCNCKLAAESTEYVYVHKYVDNDAHTRIHTFTHTHAHTQRVYCCKMRTGKAISCTPAYNEHVATSVL